MCCTLYKLFKIVSSGIVSKLILTLTVMNKNENKRYLRAGIYYKWSEEI